jgi:hypothetical protein
MISKVTISASEGSEQHGTGQRMNSCFFQLRLML